MKIIKEKVSLSKKRREEFEKFTQIRIMRTTKKILDADRRFPSEPYYIILERLLGGKKE